MLKKQLLLPPPWRQDAEKVGKRLIIHLYGISLLTSRCTRHSYTSNHVHKQIFWSVVQGYWQGRYLSLVSQESVGQHNTARLQRSTWVTGPTTYRIHG